MNLGEKIYELRTKKNLSQGDVAEALDVSRQSVSKWENNNAVPDLDKIIKLAEIFEVSLDELVLNKLSEATPTEHSNNTADTSSSDTDSTTCHPQTENLSTAPHKIQKQISSTQRTVGTILFCTAALLLLCFTILAGGNGFFAGLLFGLPFLLCGILCFTIKYRAGLWCAWALFCCVDLFLRFATGISWSMIRITPYFEASMNYARLAMAWIIFFVILVLMLYTIRCFVKDMVSVTKRQLVLSIAALLILLLFGRLIGPYLLYRWTGIISALFSWARMWGIIAVCVTVIKRVQLARMQGTK